MFIDIINSLVANPDVSFFTIPVSNTVAFTKKVRTLMTKANKLGVDGVVLTKLSPTPESVLRSVTREVYDPRIGHEVSTRVNVLVDVNMFMITGLVPRINGEYTLLAKCEHTATGVLVTSAPHLSDAVPLAYRTAAPVCDHCKKVRSRKETFVVRNDETGEILSVGRTCLLDFFGKAGMAQLLWSSENLDAMASLGSYGDLDAEYSRDAVSTDGYLMAVLYAIHENKGVFAPAALGSNSTSSQAQGVLHAIRKTPLLSAAVSAFYGDAVSLRKAALAKFEAMDASAMSSYEHNLYTCLKSDIMSTNLAYGILASLPKYMGATAARTKTVAAVSAFVGAVGDKAEFDVVVAAVHDFETQYGSMRIYKLTDANGNVLVWKTSTSLKRSESEYAVPGDSVTIKATIKSHEVYKGRGDDINQTVLTRVSVVNKAVAA